MALPSSNAAAAQAVQVPRAGMARGALHLGVGQVLTTTLTVLLSAATARTLGAADFGLLYLVTSIATFAFVLVDWGHSYYSIREIARHPGRSGELMGSLTAVRGVALLVVCGPAVAATWLLGYGLRTSMLTGAMLVALAPVYQALSYSWVFRGNEHMDYDAFINVTLKFSTLALTVTALAMGGRLLSVILASAVSGIITLGLAMALYKRLGLPHLRATLPTARELIRGGAPLFTMNLAIAVQPYIDANLLYKFAPRGVVGWYGAAWTIAGTLVAPAAIVAATAYPRLSKTAHDAADFKRALQALFRPLLLVAVLGAVGTYVFADLAVSIVYSRQKFGPAADILRAFAPAVLLIYVDMLLGVAILSVGKATRLAGAKFVAVIVTVGLEFWLIPLCQARFGNGGIGLMFAMAAGELTMVFAAFLLIPSKTIDRSLIFDLARGLLAGVTTLMLLFSLPPLSPFIGIPLCVLTLIAASAVLGLLTRRDAEFLFEMLRKRERTATERTSV